MRQHHFRRLGAGHRLFYFDHSGQESRLAPPCSPTSLACFSARFRKIDADNEGEIRYPRKDLNVAKSDSDTDENPKTDRNSDANSHPDPDYTNSWDPSIREPNLKAEPL